MSNFGLDNYDIFSNAMQTTNFNKTTLLNESNVINVNVSGLNDSDVFQGMICESIITGWEAIQKKLDNAINELNTTSSTLQGIQNNYQSSDKINESEIGEV